jgi:hypothetical protein
MKSYLLFFLVAISFNQNIAAQETELDDLIAESKVKMKAFGYKLIGEGSMDSNRDNQLTFNQKRFYGATTYKIITIVEKCTDCALLVQFEDASSETSEFAETEILFGDRFNVMTSEFSLYMDRNGMVVVNTNSEDFYFIHSMLYFK